MQNNSTHNFTPDCESVDILFGLSPSQIYHSFGRFFDSPRMCSVALMEMLNTIVENNSSGQDTSVLIELTRPLNIMVNLERMQKRVDSLFDHFKINDKDTEFSIAVDFMQPDARETVMSLHYELLNIVSAVDKMGFIDFSSAVAAAISDVSTRQAYEDMVCAMSCIHSVYVAYVKNLYYVTSKN